MDTKPVKAAQKCLQCKEKPEWRRGLCTTCHNKYRAGKLRVPPEKRYEYEQRLIDRGLLAPNRQGKTSEEEANPYDEIAREILAGTPPAPLPADPVTRAVNEVLQHQAEASPQQTAADPPRKYKRRGRG